MLLTPSCRYLDRLKDRPLDLVGMPFIEEDLFRMNPMLEIVHLDSSGVNAIPAGLLRNNPNVRQLTVHNNNVSVLPEDLLVALRGTSSLYLCVTLLVSWWCQSAYAACAAFAPTFVHDGCVDGAWGLQRF